MNIAYVLISSFLAIVLNIIAAWVFASISRQPPLEFSVRRILWIVLIAIILIIILSWWDPWPQSLGPETVLITPTSTPEPHLYIFAQREDIYFLKGQALSDYQQGDNLVIYDETTVSGATEAIGLITVIGENADSLLAQLVLLAPGHQIAGKDLYIDDRVENLDRSNVEPTMHVLQERHKVVGFLLQDDLIQLMNEELSEGDLLISLEPVAFEDNGKIIDYYESETHLSVIQVGGTTAKIGVLKGKMPEKGTILVRASQGANDETAVTVESIEETATLQISPSPSVEISTIDVFSDTEDLTLTPTISATIRSPVMIDAQIVPSSVNIRQGPHKSHPNIDRDPNYLRKDDEVKIIGRNRDASWYEVELIDGARGWISRSSFTLPEEKLLSLPIIPVPTLPRPTATITPEPAATPSPTSDDGGDPGNGESAIPEVQATRDFSP